MSRGVPERGDVVELDFDPTKGHEIRGFRPALVLSTAAFNKASGLLLVAPITQGGRAARESGFALSLMGTGTKTQGVVLCDQTRTIDARARAFRRIEKAPAHFIDDVLHRVRMILE